MRTTRRAILGTAAASITLAGCVGDGDEPTPTDSPTAPGADDTPTETETATPTEDGMGASEATVQVGSHPEHGDVLVDADGMTLYMFDQDEQGAGESACSGDCLDNWPVLTADETPDAGDGVGAELTTFEREDGDTQVAANGWPLYYFVGDDEPGDAAGQGAGDVWWVLDPEGNPITPESTETEDEEDTTSPTVRVESHEELGDVLVDADGMTLYMFDQDERGAGESSCAGDCVDNWPPLTVEGEATAGDGVGAELTTFEREDGSVQVAANGWPLYYFVSDEEPGDTEGQGVGDVWWVLDPEGTPIRPEETPTDETNGDGGYSY